MPIAPVHRLKKKEIVWLGSHRCREHSHTYLEHYSCYLKENPDREKIGFLDIEASNLDADFGIMLSYCIKEHKKNKIYWGIIEKKEDRDLDREVVERCINDMGRFDKIITFYGTKFDIPFIRTRALNLKIPFPNYGSIIHKDVYYIIRNKMKLSSNRLENACRVLLGKTQKTRIESKYWIWALRGDKKSLIYILDHNKKDVIDLENLYKKVIEFVGMSDTSI